MQSARTPTLESKLNSALSTLNTNDVLEDINYLLDNNPARFSSANELSNHLVEGALLNISVIGSKALSVPCGEYMVWATDAGHTMLVPTKKSGNGEVFEHDAKTYEVFTHDLLKNWNRIDKTLAEDFGTENSQPEQKQPPEQNQEPPVGNRFGSGDEADSDSSISGIQKSTVDRQPIMRAMEDRGYTVTSLARACGVDPPAISRILRTPKDRQGDPGGRNPSMGLAARICDELRIDPTAAFPDIFSANSRDQARQQPGNRGSGMGSSTPSSNRKGKASKLWTQGNTSESFEPSEDEIMEMRRNRYSRGGRQNWTNVQGSIIRPIAFVDNEVFDDGSPFPDPEVGAALGQFMSSIGVEDAELVIKFYSSGSHTPMSMYGGPDQVGWPEEHDEERNVVEVFLVTDTDKHVALPKDLQDAIGGVYQNKVDEHELESVEPDDYYEE